jgi:hypothetical protein
MSVQLQDRFPDPLFPPNPDGFGSPFAPSPTLAGPSSDAVSRLGNPWANLGQEGFGGQPWSMAGSSPFGNLFAMLQSLIAQLGSWMNGTGTNQHFFSSATGGSNGDPHLSFNGQTWNDMQSENDLLCSDSVPGGYRLSTQTTQPNASGITYNQQATVTTDGGATRVTLGNDGNATYTQGGFTCSLAAGQSVNLGNGEIATRAQNGTLTITNTTPQGGIITTTMSQNGQGVDVNVSASNVDLGGTLADGGASPATPSSPSHRPVFTRY